MKDIQNYQSDYDDELDLDFDLDSEQINDFTSSNIEMINSQKNHSNGGIQSFDDN